MAQKKTARISTLRLFLAFLSIAVGYYLIAYWGK